MTDHPYQPGRAGYWRTNGKSRKREWVTGSGPCRVCGVRHSLTDKLAELRDNPEAKAQVERIIDKAREDK